MQCGIPGFDPWVGKIPWRRKWHTRSSILAWRIPWMEEPGGLQSMGSQRVRHDWATSLSLSLWRPTRPTRTPQKDVLLIIGDWNGKVGSQEIPGVKGKFDLGVQNEAGQRLIEFCQENTLIIANTLFQQHKRIHMDITRWSILKPDWLYSLQLKMEKLYTVSKNKTRSWLWLRSWTPDCQIQT